MAKLGYTSSYDEMPEYKHVVFTLISEKLDKLEDMDRKKKTAAAKRKKGKR